MPISVIDLKKTETRNKTKELILFLKEHSTEAFTSKELSKTLNISELYMNPLLNRLRKQKIVQHQKPYWHYKTNGGTK